MNHEMNRCIQCYRCVRFYRDYAGGRDLNVMASHNAVYFGRHEDGPLESEFAGNLVEVCPTGVFTDKTLKRHYARKWDLQTAPSVCVHCGVGCNTIAGERYGTLQTHPEPVQPRGERLFPLRPRPIRVRVRQSRQEDPTPLAGAERIRPAKAVRKRSTGQKSCTRSPPSSRRAGRASSASDRPAPPSRRISPCGPSWERKISTAAWHRAITA